MSDSVTVGSAGISERRVACGVHVNSAVTTATLAPVYRSSQHIGSRSCSLQPPDELNGWRRTGLLLTDRGLRRALASVAQVHVQRVSGICNSTRPSVCA